MCARRETLLQDLGVDSLALLEMVEIVQDRLAIIVPDEVTARIQSVADLQDAVDRLTATVPVSEPTVRT
ncbi:acyl carrier protein [Streptomyces sp. MK37H]|uniref:acyl carrier protein n=1 Tax=Streptomyces sp. MK37H TaxID=2699117 RepID=UPI0035A999AE